jgi:hypothetical protein
MKRGVRKKCQTVVKKGKSVWICFYHSSNGAIQADASQISSVSRMLFQGQPEAY